MDWYTLVGMFFFLFWHSLVGMPWTVRRCLACHRLPYLILHAIDWHTLDSLPWTGRPWKACFDWLSLVGVPLTGRRWLVCYAIDWQTLTGMSLACRPSLACHAWANLGWHTSFPADLCCWHAIVLACHLLSIYAAKLCLISSLPTICTISNYLHYFQLFTTTLPNYSQLFALFPTIHKYFQLGRAWLVCYWLAELGCYAIFC